MRTTVELSDVHDIVFVLQHSSLVVVHIQIIGRRKNGNQWGETCRLTFSVHAIPGKKEGSTSSNQILIVYLFLDRLTQRLVLHELELWIISYFAVENHSWLHNCNKKLYFYMNPDQIILDFFRIFFVIFNTCKSMSTPWQNYARNVLRSSRCQNPPEDLTTGGHTWDQRQVVPWSDPTETSKWTLTIKKMFKNTIFRKINFLIFIWLNQNCQ